MLKIVVLKTGNFVLLLVWGNVRYSTCCSSSSNFVCISHYKIVSV